LKDIFSRFELTDGHLLEVVTVTAYLNYSIARELQFTPEASGIEWPALGNHIPFIAHLLPLALSAFLSGLGIKGRTICWEAHERDQPFEENESIDIGKCQRLRKEGNARIINVLAMTPGVTKIIENVLIS